MKTADWKDSLLLLQGSLFAEGGLSYLCIPVTKGTRTLHPAWIVTWLEQSVSRNFLERRSNDAFGYPEDLMSSCRKISFLEDIDGGVEIVDMLYNHTVRLIIDISMQPLPIFLKDL